MKTFTILDIGARGGLKWPWKNIKNLNQILIEADKDEADNLERIHKLNKNIKVYHAGLWDRKDKIKIRITKSAACSSFYEHNKMFLKRFPSPERFELDKIIEINVQTLDELANINKIKADFIKIDIEGAELNAFKGGKNFIYENIIGIESEVSFVNKNINQPKFSEVDIYLRENLGFELFDLNQKYWKYEKGKRFGALKGRIIFADALYLRPIENIYDWLSKKEMQVAKHKFSALVLSAYTYGLLDYAYELILDKKLKSFHNEDFILSIQKKIKNTKLIHLNFKGSIRLFYFLNYILNIFYPSEKKFGMGITEELGNKIKGGLWR